MPPDALYDMRTLATDNAGNTTASATQTRTLDNNGPTSMLTNPAAGASVRGTLSVDVAATDVSGVASVAVQYRVVGAATWTTLCTDTTSPYSCPLNTTTLVSGSSYEIRLVGTDTLAKTTTTAPVTVTVDNVVPTGANVQGTNGGTAGVLDAGDALTVTFSEPMLPVSILAGWDGSATPITVHINNAGSFDTLDVYDAANTTKANVTGASLELDEDYVSTNATFNATMQRVGSDITITFGALTSGSRLTGVRKGRLVWTPSAAATDLAGNACSGAAVTEPGGNDQDF